MQVKVRVQANARKETFEALSETSFRISVREKAQENAANARVRELVARHFRVPAKSVRVIRGHTAPAKTLSVGALPLSG